MNKKELNTAIGTAQANLVIINDYLQQALEEMDNQPDTFDLSKWLTDEQVSNIISLECDGLYVLLDHLGAT